MHAEAQAKQLLRRSLANQKPKIPESYNYTDKYFSSHNITTEVISRKSSRVMTILINIFSSTV